MDTRFENKLNRFNYVIHPGEFHATSDPVIISTVLGSCISVVLFDAQAHIGGMNHFLLPGSIDKTHLYNTSEGRYGIFAMELLINQMIKIGANRSRLQAKVFGGAHMFKFNTSTESSTRVSDSNVAFAFEYLKTENIPIVSHNVGGNHARKVLFMPDTFQVFLKAIRKSQEEEQVAAEESKFLTTVKKTTEKKPTPTVELF